MAEKKTAQEKATEALGVATRKVEALEAKQVKAKADLATIEKDLETAKANRDYVAQHPALQAVDIDPSPVEDGINKPTAPDGSLGF